MLVVTVVAAQDVPHSHFRDLNKSLSPPHILSQEQGVKEQQIGSDSLYSVQNMDV